MKHNYVPDGCFLLARQIFDSAIWRDDPHVLKLFIYLIGNARHKKTPKKYPTFEIKRGELVTSLAKIAEENEYNQNGTIKIWARMKISRMLDLLGKQGYIVKLCDTYGTHVSICNYDLYQDMNNYKCDTVVTQVGSSCDTSGKQVGINNKGNKDINEKNEKNKDIYIDFPELNIEAWLIWKAYKKEIKCPYKTERGEKAKIAALIKLSNGDKDVQRNLVDHAIDEEWKGIHVINNQNNSRGKGQVEKKHVGLNKIDYNKGVNEDGSF